MDRNAVPAKAPDHPKLSPTPNEHGVYPCDEAETIIISCKGAYLEIYLLELKSGWIAGVDAVYRCGDYVGKGVPLKVGRQHYNSRAEALGVVLEWALEHFDPQRLERTPTASESQRKAAEEMRGLIEKRINAENQETLFS